MYHNQEIMTGWKEVMTSEEFKAKEAKRVNATTGQACTVKPYTGYACLDEITEQAGRVMSLQFAVGSELHAELLAAIEACTKRYSNIELTLHWPGDSVTAEIYTVTDGVRKKFVFLKKGAITRGSERTVYLALTYGVLI